ncbi:MAG: cytochrome c [Rhodospirillales bacterium]|jgi:mono/diheme cytochrome c family protein|nr:cytochrome c [Rhodospirillaceae bacterium]MBT6218931.1 cytochrome c [Rhodospirillaceae bacterium]MBT8003537.1 cytochrome c [Rhodospirillales bacterium]
MKNILKRIGATGAALGFIGLLVYAVPAASGSKAIYENPIEPQPTPELNIGKMNYEAHCASCHGKTAGGTDKGPTFISRIYHPGHHGDGAFYIAAKRGARAHHWPFGNMKPIPGITDQQIAAIVAYVRAVQKANGLF